MAEGDPTGAMESSASNDALAGIGDMISGGMKGMTGVLEGIMQVVSKLFSAIIDASPMLQGVLKIVDKMFKMILMPIGNLIARLLLPIAIKMANKTMQFLSKFGNAGPDQLEEMMEAGMTIALDSFIEMIGVILTKVLVPILKGLAKAIANVIADLIPGGKSSSADMFGENQYRSMGDEISDLMGGASAGFVSVIDQFGMTVQTGNKEIGTSQTELATIFYTGAVDIANGFQSLHEVLAIGTPGILSRFETEFNTAAAGVYTSINTLTMNFPDLIDALEKFRIAVVDATPEPDGGDNKNNKWGAADWAQLFISPIGKMVDTWTRGYKFGGARQSDKETRMSDAVFSPGTYLPMATGGIATKPIKALIGEAGPEAVIPLNKMKGTGGQSIDIHIHGDIYGMDDFNRKIEQAVGKYSSKIRGAY